MLAVCCLRILRYTVWLLSKPAIMSRFNIPARQWQCEHIIKKSRFIAYIQHADSPQAAHAFIQSIRDQYPDARHVCWAFVAGEPNNTPHVSCSDDGEPSGTAGKPMLNVLQHSDVGEVVAVVVRYFGGIKLGTGGLVRAYSGVVTEAMQKLPTKAYIRTQRLELSSAYALEDVVRRTLQHYQADILDTQYQEQLHLACHVPLEIIDALIEKLNDVGRGQIVVKLK